jgi:maltose O-acetyltransferase
MGDVASRRWAFGVNILAASPLVRPDHRVTLLRRAGIQVDDPVDLRPHCWIYGDRLTIGAGTFISYGCHIENREAVRIGRGCAIANQVTLLTSTHHVGPTSGRAGEYAGAPVSIEAGCWIGARATILPGVTIGRGCVVGAGAVVTRDCEPDYVYVGSPARALRPLSNNEPHAREGSRGD